MRTSRPSSSWEDTAKGVSGVPSRGIGTALGVERKFVQRGLGHVNSIQTFLTLITLSVCRVNF